MNIANELFGTSRRSSINSKQKGNRNEVRLANMISKWTGAEFKRTPMSGGLNYENKILVGADSLCTDPFFFWPFSLETKWYSVFHFNKLLRANSIIYSKWAQTLRDANETQRTPLFIFRENKGSFKLCISDNDFDAGHLSDTTPIIAEGRDLCLYEFKPFLLKPYSEFLNTLL